MTENEFISLIEEILEAPAGSVAIDSDLEEIDWDSLSNISFIAEIDERLGTKVDADVLANAKKVSDLYRIATGE